MPKRVVKRKKGNRFDNDWTDKLDASKGSYYKQQELEEGQDLEEVAKVFSSHTKLLLKTMQGSDDDNEVSPRNSSTKTGILAKVVKDIRNK